MIEGYKKAENNRYIEKITIPEFGDVEIIDAINAVGCVDPRKSLVFIEPLGQLAKEMKHNPNIRRLQHHDGAERSPGASFGKAMSLLGADPELTPQRAVDLVREWEESEGRTFTMHEDDHSYGHGLGCGHIDRSSKKENEALYGLPSEKVRTMKDYVLESAKQGEMRAEVPMLTNSHREKGVLVVLSKDKTVIPVSDSGEEFFRFDATRHDASLGRLASFVRSKGVAVNAEALITSAERQRNATLMLLAAGHPIYEINLQGQTRSITAKGTVPQPPKK